MREGSPGFAGLGEAASSRSRPWLHRPRRVLQATRYEGNGTKPDLYLSDDPSVESPWGTSMGDLTAFIEWNRQHPPAGFEERRNDLIHQQFQHNRKPFIDYPDLVDAIWTSDLYLAPGTWRVENFTFAELDDEAISGWLADPGGDGIVNLHEYAFGSDPWRGGPGRPVEVAFHGGGLGHRPIPDGQGFQFGWGHLRSRMVRGPRKVGTRAGGVLGGAG